MVQAEFTAARRRASSPLQHTTQHLESSFECGAHEFALAHLQSQLAIALSCFTEPEAAAVVTMCTTIITTRIRAVRIDACGLTTLMPFNGLCDEVMEWIVRWIGRACAVRGEAAR